VPFSLAFGKHPTSFIASLAIQKSGRKFRNEGLMIAGKHQDAKEIFSIQKSPMTDNQMVKDSSMD